MSLCDSQGQSIKSLITRISNQVDGIMEPFIHLKSKYSMQVPFWQRYANKIWGKNLYAVSVNSQRIFFDNLFLRNIYKYLFKSGVRLIKQLHRENYLYVNYRKHTYDISYKNSEL